MTQLTLFGLSCALVSLGCAAAFAASVNGRWRRPGAALAGVLTVAGMGVLIGAAMTT